MSFFGLGLLKLTPPIQIAVLNGFRNMINPDRLFGLQIRNGSGDFQNTVKRPGGQAQLVDGRLQQAAGGIVDLAMGFDVAAAHLGVAV